MPPPVPASPDAEPALPGEGLPAKPPAPVRKPDVKRIFHEPEIRLVRMGRVVATYRAAYGTWEPSASRVVLYWAKTAIGRVAVKAGRLALDLLANRVSATGGVELAEKGVTIETERLTAAPSLTRLEFGRQVVIRADGPDSARKFLASGVM